MIFKNIIQMLKRLFSCGKKQEKSSGTIKFFDRKKRFGFIVSGKHEYFFHAAATKPSDFKALRDGVEVRFSIIQGKKGPQADDIEVL